MAYMPLVPAGNVAVLSQGGSIPFCLPAYSQISSNIQVPSILANTNTVGDLANRHDPSSFHCALPILS